MKISFIVGFAAGYVLGAKAGRERYEEIAKQARKLKGSQTFQATAGVLNAQLDTARSKAMALVNDKRSGRPGINPSANGVKS